MLKIIVFLTLFLTSFVTFADTTSYSSAISGGQVSESPSAASGPVLNDNTDLSRQILAKMFGNDILSTVGGSGAPSVTDDGGSFLEKMFEIFNGIVITITVGIGIYILISGIAQSAHEGVPLGQRYNTFWLPVRTSFAFAMIAPIPVLKGYSAAQAVVLGLSLLSIEAANTMSHSALTYITNKGSLVTPVVNSDYEATQMALSMMTSMTCNNYQSKRQSWYEGSPSTIIKSSDSEKVASIVWTGLENGINLGKNCGEIKIDCTSAVENAETNPMGQTICQAKQAGMMAMYTSLDASINNMVNDFETIKTTTFTDAINAYTAKVKTSLETAKTQAEGQRSSALADFSSKSTAEGWITMGSWYWVVATINNRMYDAAKTTYQYVPPEVPNADISQEKIDASYASLQNFVNRLYLDTSKSNENIAQAVYDMKNGEGSAWLMGRALLGWTGVAGSEVQMKDPLVSLGYLGDALFSGVAFAKETSANAIEDAVSSLTNKIMLLAMISGVALKFYLPLLPYILWTMGILGWLVMLVESMIAAPLWAAAHALPDGQGIIGNRASQGYQLLINVLLRPMLLTLGFFISIIVMWIISWLFLRGFVSAVEGSLSGASWSGYAGVIGTIALITIMTIFLILLINRSFSMIYETADNLMKWIGNGVSGAGEFKAAQYVQENIGQVSKSGIDSVLKPSEEVKTGGQQGGSGQKTEKNNVESQNNDLLQSVANGKI